MDLLLTYYISEIMEIEYLTTFKRMYFHAFALKKCLQKYWLESYH